MPIKLGHKAGSGPVLTAHNHTYYPEISVPREKVKGHKQGKDYHAKVKLRASSVNDHSIQYEVHNIDFDKGPAKSVDEAVDNAAEETQEEKNNSQDNDEEKG